MQKEQTVSNDVARPVPLEAALISCNYLSVWRCYSSLAVLSFLHHTHTHTHARARARAHTHTHTHTHTHIYTHTHTRTRANTPKWAKDRFIIHSGREAAAREQRWSCPVALFPPSRLHAQRAARANRHFPQRRANDVVVTNTSTRRRDSRRGGVVLYQHRRKR